MNHKSYCLECPRKMSCGQLKQLLLIARQKVDQDGSGRELNGYYGALLYLQTKRWYYPHNVSPCYFNNRTSILDQTEKLKKVFLHTTPNEYRVKNSIRRTRPTEIQAHS